MIRHYTISAVTLSLLGAALFATGAAAQQEPDGLASPGLIPAVRDVFRAPAPNSVQPGGVLGERYRLSREKRLLTIDEAELLSGYQHRPGSHPWIGEHIGKWLHAASLTYACTHDEALRAKLDRVAGALMQTQEANGYLGTYGPDKRFGLYPEADWDVWSHKYNLIGLLTYYQYTGNRDALAACRRMGDLLITVFGPGKKSILSAGTQVGMAATSVLEPMTLLYRATEDKRYLDFAEYIVTAWDEAGGPRVLSALLAGEPVYRVANGKAYEMTSNLVGLCELYRVTGKRPYLDAVLNAWNDIAANRLYLTGSGSSHELWQPDYQLPDDAGAQICETCVTVTWMQLNMELLRLLGEARFAEQIEKTLYNHLLGAQAPAGDDWSYYTPLKGRKPFESVTTCCHSSGPRGVALAPEFLYTLAEDGIAVNVYGASSATLPITGVGEARVEQDTTYPFDGTIALKVTPKDEPKSFALRLRAPAWATRWALTVNGKAWAAKPDTSGYIVVARTWKAGDVARLKLDMTPRITLGAHDHEGRMAIQYGPLTLAADRAHNPDGGANVENVAPVSDRPDRPRLRRLKAEKDGTPAFVIPGLLFRTTDSGVSAKTERRPLVLVPYYAAGADKTPVSVWLARPSTFAPTPQSLFQGAEESRTRHGNAIGSICDGDTGSFVVTFDGAKPNEDWFAIARNRPATVRRIVFVQGRLFHDGGWFDTSSGKPRVQVQRAADGTWEDVATLDRYPATTATSATGLKSFDEFSVEITPQPVYGIRILGKPSSGDNPAQAFSSCAELSAY